MKRSAGEIVRLRHTLERMRTTVGSIERALELPGPIGMEAAQAVMITAFDLGVQIAKHDAFKTAEEDPDGEHAD